MHWKKQLFNKFLRSFSRKSCKKYYDGVYGDICRDLGVDKNAHVDGEEDWVKRWSDMKIVPNPMYYRLFSRYCGKSVRIVPEDICRMVIEPVLNPERFRRAWDDKNLWDMLFPKGIFPLTTLRCMDGMFYTADYQRLVGFDNKKLYDLLTLSGEGKFFIKPTRDSCSSRGTSSINCENGKWYLGKERCKEVSIEYLIELSGPNFIIQPFLKQHSEIAKFCPTSVNPIRLITYRSVKDDEVHVLKGAMLRIGAAGEENDGAHGNGMFVGINNDGSLKHEAADYLGHVKTVFNDIDFSKDYIIPGYDKAKSAAEEIAKKVLHHRLLAFDVMIGEDGNPIIFEFNIDGFSMWLSQFIGEPAFDDFDEEIIEYCRKKIDDTELVSIY